MFDYTVCPDNDNEKFFDSCKAIEQAFMSANKKKILIDVDGSLVQMYEIDNSTIQVFNDFDMGAVYIQSEVDLSEIFS